MTDYVTDFVEESREHITELNNWLLELEGSPEDEEAIGEIFRIAHTLKGNCGAMGLTPASDLAHAIEDVLEAVRADEVTVTPELMDTIFEGVDDLETMIDELTAHGEVRTDPGETIQTLREHVDVEFPSPTDGEIDDLVTRLEAPTGDGNAYFVRIGVETRHSNAGVLVVDALVDAFDLLGTAPPRERIDEECEIVDAVFATSVESGAITAALEPVEVVDDFEIVPVTERFETDAPGTEVSDDPGEELSSERATEMEVDELLGEFEEFDDLDAAVEDIGDVDAFDDMGDAGAFDDLLDEGDLEAIDGGAPEDDEPADREDGVAEESTDTEDDGEVTGDSNAVFNDLKDEVEMVGFDELQSELEALEFEEFDEDELSMDELLGDELDPGDDTFLGDEADEPLEDEADEPLEAEDEADEPLEAEDEADEPLEAEDETDEPLEAEDEDDEPLEAEDETDEPLEAEDEADEPLEAEDEADEPLEDEADEPLEDEADEQLEDEADEQLEAEDEADEPLEAEDETDEPLEAEDETDEPLEAEEESEPEPTSVDTGDDEPGESVFLFGHVLEPAGASNDAKPEAGIEREPADGPVDEGDLEVTAEGGFDDPEDGFDVQSGFGDETVTDLGFDEERDLEADEYGLEDSFGDDLEESESVRSGSSGEPEEFGALPAGDAGEFDPTASEFDPTASEFDPTADIDETAFGESDADGTATEPKPAPDEGTPGETMAIPDITVPEVEESAEPGDDEPETERIQSLRVNADQIDTLLTLVEGLVTSRVRLRNAVDAGEDIRTIDRELDDLEDIATDLQEAIVDVRLVPLKTVTGRLPRVVRDIARDQDKKVDFEITGEDVELDRTVLERIGDPLMHLVRNAVDHGIEPPEEREAADKPREGTVELRAERERERVVIQIEDDGGGLEPDRLRAEAVDADVLSETEAEELPPEDVYDLVFHPGLSTAEEITDVSGRGVGMDVVKRTIDDLEGTISVESEPGEGTTVTLSVPVTVAISEVLFVESGGREFGIPAKVVEDVETATAVSVDDDWTSVEMGEDTLPIVGIAETLGTTSTRPNEDGMIVRIREEVRPIAVHCDDIRDQQEVVIKPFEGFMSGIPGLSGATARGRGKVVNILDVKTL